jgi:hypothetical protein
MRIELAGSGIDEQPKEEATIRDAICGHSPRTVADIYETPNLEDMAEALKRFPRYELE